MSVTLNPAGMRALQEQLTAGLNNIADAIYDVAYVNAPVELIRDPAYTKEELHVNREHADEWPVAAVFVATGSGDGFWVHEGTEDTPAHPFLAQALDAVRWQFAGLMHSASRGREGGIHRE